MNTITQNDVSQILKVIDETQNLDEVDLVIDGVRLHVRRSAQGGPVEPVAATAAAGVATVPVAEPAARIPVAEPKRVEREPDAEVPEGMAAIRAPMLGSFFRSPSPGERPFVEPGQKVKADDTVCLIEVMKLFNSISAGVNGEVVRILVGDGELVEYNQVLVVIRPDAKAD